MISINSSKVLMFYGIYTTIIILLTANLTAALFTAHLAVIFIAARYDLVKGDYSGYRLCSGWGLELGWDLRKDIP
jgi:hypothetical protein